MVKSCKNSILSLDRYDDFCTLCFSIFNDCYDLNELDDELTVDAIVDTFLYLRDWYNPERNNNPYYFIKYNLINRYNKKITSNENYLEHHEKIKIELFNEYDDVFLIDDIMDVATSIDNTSRENTLITHQNIIFERVMGLTIKEIALKYGVAPSLVHKKLIKVKNKCIEVGLFSD